MTKVEEYILELPNSVKEIASYLRKIILLSHPAIKEKIKYNCPFYEYKKNICYFYKKYDTIILGFIEGKKLSIKSPLLIGEQKQVRHLVLKSLNEINEEEIKYLLQEAILLDNNK